MRHMKRSHLLRTVLLLSAISFVAIYPLLPLDNSVSNDLFFLLRGDDPALQEIKDAAVQGNLTGAKILLHRYFVNRSLEPYSKLSSSNVIQEMQSADLSIRRIFTVVQTTRAMYNCSESGLITVNGRVIYDTNWHRNPYPHDDEWIWQLSRWGWLRDLARSYLGNIAIGNISTAEYYAENLVDTVTDFIQKEPVGTMYTWRTIDSAIRIASAIGAVDAIKNSSAFTPEFCFIFLRFLVDHGRYLADFHKVQFNWAFIESGAMIELCSYLPEITEIDSWQNIAWNQFERAVDNTFYPDGGNKEQAINYHRVATGRLANAIKVAQQFEHITAPTNLLNELVRMYVYILHNTLPDYYSNSFGDSGVNYHKSHLGTASQLCNHPELDYFDANGNPIPGNMPPRLNVIFPDSGIYISRSRWNDSDALYSFFDGGPFGEFYHAHFDFGSIQIAAFDRRLIVDPGRSSYTMDEMSRYTLSSYSHNVVLIDDQTQGAIDPSSSSWAAGYLGSCARAAHNDYGAKLEREFLFANFRNNLIQDANLTIPSSSDDVGRYWVVSDFWAGSGSHDIAVQWQMPKYQPIFVDNASIEINQSQFTNYIRCVKTNFGYGNIGIYGFGPWSEMLNISGGDSATYGQPYGWYTNKSNYFIEGVTLRYLGSINGPSNWFTVLYPAPYDPNITITTPPFQYGGQNYSSGGLGNAPGNILYIQHSNGSELHISLSEPTSSGKNIELNLSGYKINFKGRQITIHFNLTNNITQIFTQYLTELMIDDEALLSLTSSTLNVHANNTLNALTCGLEPLGNVNAVYIGAKLLPSQNYTIENSAINLGTTILGGGF